MGDKSHVFISGTLKGFRLLCTNEKKIHGIGGVTYNRSQIRKINGVRQWSYGAAHNSNCKDCLEKYAQILEKNQAKLNKAIDNLDME